MRGHQFDIPVKKYKKTFCPDCKHSKEEFKKNISNNYEIYKRDQNKKIKVTADNIRKVHSHDPNMKVNTEDV